MPRPVIKSQIAKFVSSFLGTAFLFILSSLFFSRSSWAAPLEAVKIGGAFALSGIAAPFGEGERNGAEMAIDEINTSGGVLGRPLELIVEDTNSSSVGSVTAINKLLHVDGVRYLIGPTWADSYPGALPVGDRAGALVLLPSAAVRAVKRSPHDFPLTFSLWYNIEREVETLLGDLKARNVTTLAAWADQDPFFELLLDLLEERAPQYGVKVIERSEFPLATSDFRTKFMRLKTSAPGGLLFGFTDEGTLLTFLKQRTTFYPELALFGLDYIDGFVARAEYAPLLRGMRYVSPAPVGAAFRERYKARFDRDPILSAPTSYDAVMVLASALRRGAERPADIATYLRAKPLSTVTFGDARFDAWGGVTESEYRVTAVP